MSAIVGAVWASAERPWHAKHDRARDRVQQPLQSVMIEMCVQDSYWKNRHTRFMP